MAKARTYIRPPESGLAAHLAVDRSGGAIVIGVAQRAATCGLAWDLPCQRGPRVVAPWATRNVQDLLAGPVVETHRASTFLNLRSGD